METQWVDKPLDPELTETPGGKKQQLQKNNSTWAYYKHEDRNFFNAACVSQQYLYKPARSCSCVFEHPPVRIDPPLTLRERRPLRR